MFDLKRVKKPLFYKFLISYIVIFLIPFVILSTIFYENSVASMRNEIVQSNMNKLEQVRNMTDLRMKELANIAMRMAYDSRLTPYMVQQPYSGTQAIEELKRYKANSSIIHDLILYYRDQNNVYSPRGISTFGALMRGYDPIDEKAYTTFKRQLSEITQPVIKPLDFIMSNTNTPRRLIAYAYPIPARNSSAHGAVLFFIQEEVLKELIRDILGEIEGNVYIFNENDVTLTADVRIPLSESSIANLSSQPPSVIDETLDSLHYSIITVQSEMTGWSFVTAIPEAQFYAQVTNFRTYIFISFAFIACIGLGSAIWLAFRQYKPIRNLSHYLSTKHEQHFMKTSKRDELTRIKDTMEFMFKNHEQLQEKINNQQPLVRDQCLMKLLKGNVEEVVEAKEVLEQLNIKWTSGHYFVVYCTFHDIPNEEILSLLSDVSFQESRGYGLELIHEHACVLIVNVKKGRSHFLERLMERLADHGISIPYMGVGKVYEGLDFVSRSFIEAKAASEYTLLYKGSFVVYFDDVVDYEGKTFWYPTEHKVKFVQSLKQGNAEVAQEMLKEIFAIIFSKEVSLPVLRCIYFDIINMVLKTIFELGLEQYANEVSKLVQFQSLQELEEHLHVMVMNICKAVEHGKESHNTELRDHILQYVDDHFMLQDLSLEKIAEEFQISVSYLSRFIKEQTGTTFTQLVWQLRVAETKRLLKETDLAVQEIVTKVGYHDVASFIRRFKNTEGVTPGQFRKSVSSSNQQNRPITST